MRRFGIVLMLALAVVGCRAAPDLPLTIAAGNGDVTEVRRLLVEGADPNAFDSTGWTALMWAARFGRVAAIGTLIGGGADPNLPDRGRNGWNALMFATHTRNDGALRALLDRGANPNAMASDMTALMMAAGYGYTPMVRLLLERGADPYIQNSRGVTALTAAVSGVPDIDRFTLGSCQTDTVRILRARTPDLKLDRTAWGRWALRLARWFDCDEVVRLVS